MEKGGSGTQQYLNTSYWREVWGLGGWFEGGIKMEYFMSGFDITNIFILFLINFLYNLIF